MQNAKAVILAHKGGGSRKALWLAIAAGIPCFGVVAAFGVAPGTLVEKVQFEHVVQEVTLPALTSIETSPQTTFVREDRIQRGDTVAALAHAGVKDEFTYVSTAGGAFLEWMEGKTLPGVEALMTAG